MIAGGIIVWFFRRKIGKDITPQNTHINKLEYVGMSDDMGMPVLIEQQAKEKEENKRKILAAFGQGRRVTNDDVQKLLGVSDATATRYLEELEKEGKIKQVGAAGKGVYYQRF